MNNPFIFGENVDGAAFCDRETEQKAFKRDMLDCQKIFLISPRRYGKTSLLKLILKSLKGGGIIPIYVDLYRAASTREFLELYCRSIAEASETTIDKALNFVREVLPRLRPKITLDSDGVPALGIEPFLDRKELSRALDDVYALPSKIAERKGKNLAVVFDEFQEIANFGGHAMEKAMRSHIQQHRRVGYIFSGSKKHMLDDMVGSEDRAFYKIGKVTYLQKIPRNIFSSFLQKHFENTGFIIQAGTLDHVLNLADDVPYNAQFLCHEIWDRFRDKLRIGPQDADDVLSTIMDEQTPFFVPQWDALSQKQRVVLKAIAIFGGANIFSQEFLQVSEVGSISTLQTSLRLLLKKGVIERHNGSYVISDVFFRAWIRKRA